MTPPLQIPHKPRRDEVFQVRIDQLDAKGEGQGWLDAVVGPQHAPMRFEFHVRRAVPGDVVNVRVTNGRRRRVDGYVDSIVEPSVDRVKPRCVHFPSDGVRPGCGGCSLQLLTLDVQRSHKRDRLRRLFIAEGLDAELVEPPVGAGDGWRYRNKMEFSFADEGGELYLGMHPGGFKYEVLDQTECWITSKFVDEFLPAFVGWARAFGEPAYRAEVGFWRSVVIRRGHNSGERLVEVVTSHLDPPPEFGERLASWIGEAYGEQITSVYWTQVRAVRGERTQRIEHHVAGRATLREQLVVGGSRLEFEIAPSAFFQTSTVGAELLYTIVAQHAAPSGTESVLDLYSGTGTIGLCLAGSAKSVLGIELVEAAVQNARENAAINSIANVEFIAGDVGEVLAERQPKADVVVVDPPRAGLMPAALAHLMALDAQRMVYVSCNPEALARDLVLLGERWRPERIRPVDMFPQTAHLETVVSLTRI